jgi:hypothetical protein
MDDNRRRLKRHGLAVNIEIYNVEEDCCIGKLANIHQQGLMIMASRPLHTERLYQLALVLGDADSKKSIPLSADCLWQSPASSEDCFWVGFKIAAISEASEAELVDIIEQYTD